MRQPTVILQFKGPQTTKAVPQVFIKSLKEAITINQDNNEVLEEIRVELISLRSWVDQYQGQIWAKEHGYSEPYRREEDYEA